MDTPIGKIIQAEVENQRLTQKEFGALINRNEKTVPDIYERTTMSIDLLVTISWALRKDFLSLYYAEDPMKSLRNDEVTLLKNQLHKIIGENKQLQRELGLAINLAESRQENFSFAKEQIEEYKLKLNELKSKVVNHDVEKSGKGSFDDGSGNTPEK